MKTQIRNLYVNKEHRDVLYLWQSPVDYGETGALMNQDFPNLFLLHILNHAPCVTWILDVRTGKFDFISKNVTELFGKNTADYLHEGLSFHDKIKHPDDRRTVWKLLFQIWKVLEEVPASKRIDYKFSLDYRIQSEDGKEKWILEQNAILKQDDEGKITHLLGVCTDITHWKKDAVQQAQLVSESDKKYFIFTVDTTSTDKPKTVLSKRELEIAKLMAAGYSSKYIADKLFISFHTVSTHRKNMIEKTHSINTCGLVQFVMCNGLI